MAVYVDKLRATPVSRAWKWRQGAHMIADSLDELHSFARSIGMRKDWFQPTSFPHYDLTPRRYAKAIKGGAILLQRRPFVSKIRAIRERRDHVA